MPALNPIESPAKIIDTGGATSRPNNSPNPRKKEDNQEGAENNNKEKTTLDNNKVPTDNERTKVFFRDFGEVADDEGDIGHRLHKAPRSRLNKDKEENDAIVSDLSGETLRWLKRRREFGAEKKVVISSFREKQLRGMFQSLDFEGNGAINLDELTEAVTYVQQKTKNTKGLEQFQNIQETFVAMDDNGDGTVDFSEFIHAMTGTSQSTFDKANEFDVERLFSYFIEYGELKQRETAWRKISEVQNIDSENSPAKIVDTKAAPSDSLSVKHFKALFGATEESERKYVSRVAMKRQAKEASTKKSAHLDQILQDFIASNTRPANKSFSLAEFRRESQDGGSAAVVSVAESDVQSVEEDTSMQSVNSADKEYLELQARLRDERKEMLERQNLILAEAGLLQRKKVGIRSSMRMSVSHMPKVEVDQLSLSKKTSSSSAELLNSTKSVHLHHTLIAPVETKQEIWLRSVAKREAYDILRGPKASFSGQIEDSDFFVRNSTFDVPHSNSEVSSPKASRCSSLASDSRDSCDGMALKYPSVTVTRKSIDATRRSADMSLPEGSIRLPSIRSSISVNPNGSSLIGGSSGMASSSKKNHMVRASFAF